MVAASQGTVRLRQAAARRKEQRTTLPPAGGAPPGGTPSPPPSLQPGFRHHPLGTRLALLGTPPSGLRYAAWVRARASRPLWLRAG